MKVAQSCPTLCDPKDYTVHGILQARILEWLAFPFSRGSSQPRCPALQQILYQLSHKGSPIFNLNIEYIFLKVYRKIYGDKAIQDSMNKSRDYIVNWMQSHFENNTLHTDSRHNPNHLRKV